MNIPLKIISADIRLNESRGVKLLIVGPTGVGKTSLLRTVDPGRVLFVDCEAGDLAVRDLPLDTVRINDWASARNLAVRVGGPNPSFAPASCYSEAHYEAVGGPLENLDRYDLIFVDSITAISRFSFRWAEQQPESRSERTGAKDLRGAYGLHAREMLMFLHQLQHARNKHVAFVGILERLTDEFNRPLGYQLQMEGAKVPREIGGIVDELIVMDFVDFGDHKPARAFVCSSPNQWGYPSKDRSGRLSQVEEPDLGKLLRKILGDRKPTLVSTEPVAAQT